MSCEARRLTTIESDCSSARKTALRRARGNCVTARDAHAGDLKPADLGSNERAVPNSRLPGRLYVTAIAGNPRAEPESYTSSECASAEPQTTALCHTVLTLANTACPLPRPKQNPAPPHQRHPKTPLGCTHSGGAPAPTAHMSLLYRYLLFSQTVWHSLRIHLEQCVAHPSVSYVPLDAPVAPHA